MDKETLRKLELLNQLSLTTQQKEDVTSFINDRELDLKLLDSIDTENVERMVHVMPILTVVREDEVKQPYSRESLQQDAPETDEGYWCVPKVVE